jgi:hypothetical protein
MSDDVLDRFYWLEALHPDPSGRIEATAHDNTITMKTEHQDEVALWLDAALVDLARPVVVERDGRRETLTPRPSPAVLCEGLEQRGDPRLAAPVRILARSRP